MFPIWIASGPLDNEYAITGVPKINAKLTVKAETKGKKNSAESLTLMPFLNNNQIRDQTINTEKYTALKHSEIKNC